LCGTTELDARKAARRISGFADYWFLASTDTSSNRSKEANQSISLSRGATLVVKNNDVMPHKLVPTSQRPGSQRTRSGRPRWSTASSSSTARSFHWVAERRLPFVATGDFHAPEHLFTWKTLLTCERTEEAVVDRLRSSAPCALMRITAGRMAA
jgi:hypothetical protein